MRKLIMLVALSGATFSHKIGDEVEFEDEEAQRFVDAKYAKYADEGSSASQTNSKGGDAELEALKARATELGIPFAQNIGATTLAGRIAEKEAELASQTNSEGGDNGGAE